MLSFAMESFRAVAVMGTWDVSGSHQTAPWRSYLTARWAADWPQGVGGMQLVNAIVHWLAVAIIVFLLARRQQTLLVHLAQSWPLFAQEHVEQETVVDYVAHCAACYRSRLPASFRWVTLVSSPLAVLAVVLSCAMSSCIYRDANSSSAICHTQTTSLLTMKLSLFLAKELFVL